MLDFSFESFIFVLQFAFVMGALMGFFLVLHDKEELVGKIFTSKIGLKKRLLSIFQLFLWYLFFSFGAGIFWGGIGIIGFLFMGILGLFF